MIQRPGYITVSLIGGELFTIHISEIHCVEKESKGCSLTLKSGVRHRLHIPLHILQRAIDRAYEGDCSSSEFANKRTRFFKTVASELFFREKSDLRLIPKERRNEFVRMRRKFFIFEFGIDRSLKKICAQLCNVDSQNWLLLVKTNRN